MCLAVRICTNLSGEAFRGASAPAQAPLTTGSKQVKNRVNDGTMARSARSPARPCCRQYGGKVAIVLREPLWYLLTLMASNTSARARFREALKAVHVVKGENGWEVLRAGHRPVKFSDRQKALKAARKFAALQKVGVLVHESGRVIEAE